MSAEKQFLREGNNALEKKEGFVAVEAIRGFDEEVLKGILRLENDALPPGWQYDDAEEYYKSRLEGEKNINIVARKNNKTIGYILLIPHNEAAEELKDDDKGLAEDEDAYYAETMEIDPKIQKTMLGGRVFVQMIERAVQELSSRGVKKITAHVRTTSGLNEVVKKYFNGSVVLTRKIESWKYGGNEPYEYTEIIAEKKSDK